MKRNPIAFCIQYDCPETKVLANVFFFHDHFTACIGNAVEYCGKIGIAIEINQRTVCAWLVEIWVVNDGAAAAPILKIVQQKTHACRAHLALWHLVIEDGFVKFFSAVKILNWNLKPVNCMCIHDF